LLCGRRLSKLVLGFFVWFEVEQLADSGGERDSCGRLRAAQDGRRLMQ
jgi:hypothetical protein